MSFENAAQIAEASNLLLGLGRPLQKIDNEAPGMPQWSPVPGKLGAYGEGTRVHRSVFLSDAGNSFNMSRIESEKYPIPGPLCDMRSLFQVTGAPSRYEGRDPMITDA